jgi:peptide/nickel transport system permease protein
VATATQGRESSRARLGRRLFGNPGAVIGAAILLAFVGVALLGPVLSPYDPYRIDPLNRLQPPSAAHWMGTDEVGRDLMSRIIHGTRFSLLVGFSATTVGMLIGVVLGMVAGFFGGWTSQAIMRSLDVLMAFPGILLAISIVAVLGQGLLNVVIAVGVSTAPLFGRLAYGMTLSAKENEYVVAARALGNRAPALLFRHILPNITATFIVQFTLRVATVILLAASLGYLGLGARPPTPEWGSMLANSRTYIRNAPHLSIFPGAAIALLVLGLNLFGDGLRDALDPKLRRR